MESIGEAFERLKLWNLIIQWVMNAEINVNLRQKPAETIQYITWECADSQWTLF